MQDNNLSVGEQATKLHNEMIGSFRLLQPEFERLVDLLTGNEAKRLLLELYKHPFLPTASRFNRQEMNEAYAVGQEIRRLQDTAVVLGGYLAASEAQQNEVKGQNNE